MKKRIDKLLVEKKLVESREKAIELIKAGFVEVEGFIIKKPSYKIDEHTKITLKKQFPYVSRAGLKLERALKVFNIDVNGKICLDIGASTGGFTHCLIKHNAKKVYAVDVGTNQLHKTLKENKKVISLENTDARNLTTNHIKDPIDILVCDVSFISILKIISYVKPFLKSDFAGILLIKPQFELSKDKLRKGIVKNKLYHIQAIEKVVNGLYENNFGIKDLTYSYPFGTDGNIEFLVNIDFSNSKIEKEKVFEIVEKAHHLKENN